MRTSNNFPHKFCCESIVKNIVEVTLLIEKYNCW